MCLVSRRISPGNNDFTNVSKKVQVGCRLYCGSSRNLVLVFIFRLQAVMIIILCDFNLVHLIGNNSKVPGQYGTDDRHSGGSC